MTKFCQLASRLSAISLNDGHFYVAFALSLGTLEDPLRSIALSSRLNDREVITIQREHNRFGRNIP